MSQPDLVHRVCDTERSYFRIANEVHETACATIVRCHGAPRIYDVNHVNQVHVDSPADLDLLRESVDREFRHLPYRCFKTDALTPPALLARLAQEEYERDEFVLLVLEGRLEADPGPVEIREVLSEDDWAAWAGLHRLNWEESSRKAGRPFEPDLDEQMARTRRAKCPPVRYWMAWVDDAPRAFGSSWSGVKGVGLVEDLFTHPEYRNRGLATALIARGTADARNRGAGPLVIPADAHDTPKHMYAALGFRPVALGCSYVKNVGAQGRSWGEGSSPK